MRKPKNWQMLKKIDIIFWFASIDKFIKLYICDVAE